MPDPVPHSPTLRGYTRLARRVVDGLMQVSSAAAHLEHQITEGRPLTVIASEAEALYRALRAERFLYLPETHRIPWLWVAVRVRVVLRRSRPVRGAATRRMVRRG